VDTFFHQECLYTSLKSSNYCPCCRKQTQRKNVIEITETLRLFDAVQKGNAVIVQELINRGANVNAARNDGITPLYIAAERGHLDVVQELITNGADVNKAMNNGTTP